MSGDELVADVAGRFALPDGVKRRDVVRVWIARQPTLVACTIYLRNGDRWRYLLGGRNRWERS